MRWPGEALDPLTISDFFRSNRIACRNVQNVEVLCIDDGARKSMSITIAVDFSQRSLDDNPGKIAPLPGPIQDNVHPFTRQHYGITPVQMPFGYVLRIVRRAFGHERTPQGLMYAPIHRDIENLLDVQPPRKDDHVGPFRIKMRTEMFLHRITIQLIDANYHYLNTLGCPVWQRPFPSYLGRTTEILVERRVTNSLSRLPSVATITASQAG